MGQKVIRFKWHKGIAWGVVRDAAVYPLDGEYPSLAEFLTYGAEQARAAAQSGQGTPLALDEVELLSPVTAPCAIICQGVNYREHSLEIGSSPADQPFNLIFSKAASSLTAARGSIMRPQGVRLLDYELELGLVIGRTITTRQQIHNLADVVAGIVMANDISARDIQIPQGQWFKGKSFRTFCPTGPYLYLLDPGDYERLSTLQLTLWVNDEVRQQASAGQLIYGPEQTLLELSEIMDLSAGDLVLTGTPGGVALQAPGKLIQRLAAMLLSERSRMALLVRGQLKNPRYLNDGDVIRSTIRSSDGQIDLGMQELTIVGS